jgi:hypothetical protein
MTRTMTVPEWRKSDCSKLNVCNPRERCQVVALISSNGSTRQRTLEPQSRLRAGVTEVCLGVTPAPLRVQSHSMRMHVVVVVTGGDVVVVVGGDATAVVVVVVAGAGARGTVVVVVGVDACAGAGVGTLT